MARLWLGIECEGRYTGLKTLFIVGKPSIERIEAIIQEHAVRHLYFGAGKTSPDSQIALITHFLKDPSLLITVETTAPQNLHKSVLQAAHIMHRIESPYASLLKPTDTIKVESDSHVHCVTKSQCLTNDFSQYKHDVIL